MIPLLVTRHPSLVTCHWSLVTALGGIFIFILLWAAAGWAETDLEDVITFFHPSLTLREEYSNNINLTATNKKEDYITTVQPGLQVSLSDPKTPQYGLDLNFLLGLNFYARNSALNYTSYNGLLNSWYTFDRRLTLRVQDSLTRSDEPREQEYTFTTPTGGYYLGTQRERNPYIRNVLVPSVDYQFGKEDHLEFSYRNNMYRSESPSAQDSTEHYLNPRLTYWFNIHHGLQLEYGFTQGEFESSPDLQGHMARGRYTYRFDPRTSVFGEYTYMLRLFEDPGTDYQVQNPSVGISHALTPTMNGKVQLGLFWYKPENRSAKIRPFYDIELNQRLEKTHFRFSWQGGYLEDFYTAENLGFTYYHRALASISHQILQRLTIGASGSGERAEYDVSDRKDWIWLVSGHASYLPLKWLELSFRLSYTNSDSNINSFDYDEIRGMLSLTVKYE